MQAPGSKRARPITFAGSTSGDRVTTAAIGIDIGGTGAKGGIVSREGEVLLRVEHATEKHSGTKSIIGVAEELLGRAKEVGAYVSAIGIGAAGFINSETGSVTFAPNLVYD